MPKYKLLVVKKPGCAPCAVLTRLLPSLQAKYSDVLFEVVEVSTEAELLALNVAITSFPTSILFSDTGEEIGRQRGALGVDQLISDNIS